MFSCPAVSAECSLLGGESFELLDLQCYTAVNTKNLNYYMQDSPEALLFYITSTVAIDAITISR